MGNIFFELTLEEIFVILNNILVNQEITLNMSGYGDSFNDAVNELTTPLEGSSPEDNIPELRRDLSNLHQKGKRILDKINKFHTGQEDKAIQINNERLAVADKIDKLFGNNTCVNRHKNSELYKYVVQLNKK